MWFKLSERKRDRIYEFLFLETQPMRDNDPEYIRRREHMLALLDNYHGASRLNAKNFQDRLECLYFVESEQELRVASSSALFDTDEEATTGVVFDTNVPEEDSDTEEITLNYLPAPVLPPPGSSTTGASSNQATPATPVRRSTPGKTSRKLLAKLTPCTVAPARLRPGSAVPPDSFQCNRLRSRYDLAPGNDPACNTRRGVDHGRRRLGRAVGAMLVAFQV